MTITKATIFYETKNLKECQFPLPNATRKQDLIKNLQSARYNLDAFVFALAPLKCQQEDYQMLDDDCAYEDAMHTYKQLFDLIEEIECYLRDHLAHLNEQ